MRPVWPQLVYWSCTAIAVGALALALYTLLTWDSGADDPLVRAQGSDYKEAMRWFVAGVIAASGAGVWVLGRIIRDLLADDPRPSE